MNAPLLPVTGPDGSDASDGSDGLVGGNYNRCLRELRRRADSVLITTPVESIWYGPGFEKCFRSKPLRGVARGRVDLAGIGHTVSENAADSRYRADIPGRRARSSAEP